MKTPQAKKQILQAARRFSAFHNNDPENVSVEKISAVGFLLGNIEEITYSVIEDGAIVHYHHVYDTPPALAISHDGKNAFILGGEWTFTNRGFEG